MSFFSFLFLRQCLTQPRLAVKLLSSKAILELLIFLLLPQECYDYRHTPPCPGFSLNLWFRCKYLSLRYVLYVIWYILTEKYNVNKPLLLKCKKTYTNILKNSLQMGHQDGSAVKWLQSKSDNLSSIPGIHMCTRRE